MLLEEFIEIEVEIDEGVEELCLEGVEIMRVILSARRHEELLHKAEGKLQEGAE